MTHPPRVAENLLASLGAETEFRDAVLGDLAEELALRAAWDGPRAARRWYYREAVRTAPHLLRNWASRLRWRDVGRLAGVVLTSHVFMVMLVLAVLTVARVVMGTLGVTSALQWIGQRDGIPLGVNFAIGSTSTVLGGYIAAWLHERAPMAAALALGVAWSALSVLVIAIVGTAPAWYAFLSALMMLAGTATGGALRTNRANRGSEA